MSRPPWLRLPPWAQTVRVRLTVLYSLVLFGVGAAGLGVTYLVVERTTDAHPITQRYEGQLWRPGADGRKQVATIEVAAVEEIESEVNLRTLDALRRYSFMALGALFVVSLGTGWVLSGRVLRPVRAITDAARDIQATDLTRRIHLDGPQDELRALGDTVDSMLDRLEQAFAAQRQLIDDASHELRSPLAIIRANLEASLAPDEADDAERQRAVAVIDRATIRMSRLVEDLVATARRDAVSGVAAPVRMGAVLREAAEDFAALAAGRRLRVSAPEGPGPTVVGDHEALRRAVGNLLSNAVRLAPSESTVRLSTGRDGTWTWAAVSDEGPGIPEESRELVFDRFWRGPEPPIPDGAGSPPRPRPAGLGLAIVRQITHSHRGHVAVHANSHGGSTFVIWIPALHPRTPA